MHELELCFALPDTALISLNHSQEPRSLYAKIDDGSAGIVPFWNWSYVRRAADVTSLRWFEAEFCERRRPLGQ